MKLRRRVGVSHTARLKKDEPKSTKIVLWDIALLSRVEKKALTNFLRGQKWSAQRACATVGQKRLAVVNEILDRCNGGYITKSQYGVYHFHDEPVVAPVRNMRVNLATGLIGKEIISPPKFRQMPSFNNLFGDK